MLRPEEELIYYQKAYAREKAARKEAEKILESKAEELYNVNKKLLLLNANLEQNLIKRTEQIKEAEQQYRQLVETANVIIYKTDINGDFTFINPTGERITEYTSDELIGKNFSEIVASAQKRKMVLFYRDQLVNKIESTYFEYRVITKSGKKIWIGQNVQLIMVNETLRGFWVVARDITERVKSDNELKKSNDKYKKLFEGAFDGVIRLDTKRRFVEWNSKMESMLGYSAKELKGMHITHVLHKKDIKESKDYLRKLNQNGFYTNYIGRVISKSGKVIDIEVNSTATYEDGKINGSIDNVRDITERVSIEKAIVRSEEKYRGIIENLEFGLLEVNTNGIIEKAYPSFCKLTGYDPEELVGRNPYDLLHPDFHQEMDNRTKQREDGVSNVYEVKIKQKSGAYKWVIISGAPYYDEFGSYRGSVGVHLDISSQKKMESDLMDANQIAQASSKAKELFLANMSHEIRTPLNAVIGLSNLLKNTELNPEQTVFATNIYNSAQSLILLVNDILDISKIESGKLEVNNSEFNLNQSVSTILSSCSYLAEKKNLGLELEIDDKLSDFYSGDELKICQILINLLNNAVKFTTSGKVILRIDNLKENEGLHEIRFAVEDTGKGIAEEALKTVFDDFSQEDNTISKEYGGTGLGLSISKKLVTILGGELLVKSKVGIGTTFSFSIVLKDTIKEMKVDLNKEENQIDWEKIKILTVEDNHVNQFVVESTIKSWGGKTAIANNGQEALNMLAEEEFDIILMDMQMPIMDGIAATKFIRQEMKSTIPIIAFTANALKKEMDKCFAVGMDDYISKPFQEEQLKSKILNLVIQSKDPKLFISKKQDNLKKTTDPLFTIERLENLSRGNKDFITRMLQIFCEDGSAQLEQINSTKDSEEIARLAHKIKPSIDYLSNKEFKDLVRNIERKDFIEQPELLDKFKLQLKALLIEANLFQKS